MAAEVKIPALGESVSEATIVRWLKQDGDMVEADEPLLEIETEKAAMDVVAEVGGRLSITQPAGARVQAGAVVGRITEEAARAADKAAPPSAPVEAPERPESHERGAASRPPAAPPVPLREAERPTPPARREPERGERPAAQTAAEVGDRAEARPTAPTRDRNGRPERAPDATDADVERVPMTALRRTIAARLVQAQRSAAILTTFNEVDLGELIALRARHRERFKARHGVDLGYMSLFARAAVLALREVPIVNASMEGDDIVYHHRVHLGIAVNTPRGLVVPVIRDADRRSLADVERAVAALAERARAGKLAPDDLAGGTFTITNGGVFGSLLSTPILNPPQSGILGMHKIEERPIAVNGQVVIRPMMYLALSYDHRLVDGAQAVTFLVRVKEQLEDPARMVLEV
ncbi:MAG TPA: 2-oxoglutarate dehydrogenase complex dihydrolipoyllysine-residue succinyltransferase [Methylomirabilota bacterium]|nr:2-oxoglutarate dehydrogenase complex dihydrolipoyllysine-residue succinyltransferase [Methylomirabilota bacterium]